MSEDVNATDKHGKTALIRAAEEGRPEVVKALIAQGANVNAKTNKGVTATMIAFNRSEDEVVQLLKEAGAKE